jgi:replicative DNA helicase
MSIDNEQGGKNNITSRKARLSNTVSSLGKIPPQALDLEEAVLGALMLEKDALSSVIDILKPEIFYHEAHKKYLKPFIYFFKSRNQ